ncbi:hypothetical protein TMES_19855 [Thalassospira mesophila]|uniref:Uncharacterized protein n=1 Tax=Thalassospira mesophila TaxID=1293891 RepID=A0A1Y2KVK8_9PROT|nr:hypothetical protein TMES_19855 [Thalassospira mesophila]
MSGLSYRLGLIRRTKKNHAHLTGKAEGEGPGEEWQGVVAVLFYKIKPGDYIFFGAPSRANAG